MFRRRSGISKQHPWHRAVLDGVSVRRRFTASSFRFWGSATSGRLGRVTVLPLLQVDTPSSIVHGIADFVEPPGGLSPPGAPRSVREPLDSYGSRCSAGSMAELPVGKERWICSA